MKKIIILNSSGNELANQLWNYTGIYAYSLEKKYALANPSFFEYGEYFLIPTAPSNPLFRFLFFRPFTNYTKRKFSFKRRVWRKIYSWYSRLIILFHKKNIICSGTKTYYLPPSKESPIELGALEHSQNNIYFDGWLFKNPVGLQRYRKEIQEYFKPRHDIHVLVESTIKNIRKTYDKIIGIHIRQGDYRTWRGGSYFIEQKRVKEIIDEYISKFEINKEKTCFLITSDGQINEKIFSELNVFVSKNNAVTDLFLLSSTNSIIGSNSTFGAFASYYGNIPLIVMQKEELDWEYYKNRSSYFENKYATFVQY